MTFFRLEAGGAPVRRLDLFVYAGEGTRPLLAHWRTDSFRDTVSLKTPVGGNILIAVANSPHNFNLGALSRYDAMERLSYGFADDDPAFPVLGGSVPAPHDSGTVRLNPLLCRIVLASVANTMDGYELLEDPRVRLRDIPDAAEVLREKDFRPGTFIDCGPWTALPCDVGYFPQEPGTVLWCYPIDLPENLLGTPRPFLEFECRIRGESCSFEVPLPALPRGCTKTVELTIDGPGSYDCRIR